MKVASEVRGVKEGFRFGTRTVIGPPFTMQRSLRTKQGVWCAVVRCDCGNVSVVQVTNITSGNSVLCRGCTSRKSNTTHGATSRRGKRHPLYLCWQAFRNRCNSPSNAAYANYGGRGIRVCKEWSESYEAFYEWAISAGWQRGLTIDRIDNDKGYEPGNCQWLTKPENTAKRWREQKVKAVA